MRLLLVPIFLSALLATPAVAQEWFGLAERMDRPTAERTWAEMYPLYSGFLVTSYDCSMGRVCEIHMDASEWATLDRPDKQNVVLLLGESLSKIRGAQSVMFVARGVSMAVYFADRGRGAIERDGRNNR